MSADKRRPTILAVMQKKTATAGGRYHEQESVCRG
jgi:hypothetical protein